MTAMPASPATRLRSIRIWLAVFITGLVLSGVTAFPLEHETRWLAAFATAHPVLPQGLIAWLNRVHQALADTNLRYPFLAYGTDWLAFAHLVLAVAFIGPYRDPVRNKWVVQFGLIACAAVPLLALIAGPLRGIPLYWRLIDCSFGIVGCIPLLVCLRHIKVLEAHPRNPSPYHQFMTTRPSPDQSQPWQLPDILSGLLLFLATALVTLWQNAHVAVLWDLSYLLDSSYRIALGQLPYKDFPFAHAPLTFIIQAAIIKLTGRVYLHHILYAAFAGATATVITQRILIRLLSSRIIATLLAAPLIFLGIYSIYPHPIYDCDCILAILIAIYLLQRAAESPARNAIAGAACILPLFFKQNIGLPFLLVLIASITAIIISRRLQRISIQPQLWFVAGACAALAIALLIIQLTVGLQNYLYWTITFAASRRLPGLGLLLGVYHQTSLLWTIPAAIAALFLLRRSKPAAILLLAVPFLWTIASLALSDDPSDRADQLLSLWPHLLLLAAALALYNLGKRPTFDSLLPLILLATIHGTFLSQQLWGSTYALWPLLTILIACLLLQIPTIATPLTAIIATTFVLCGNLYAFNHERLSYTQLSGPLVHATLPQLRGLATPGPYLADFEQLIRDTDQTIPQQDAILLLPGQDPFYFATGRTPRFPVLLFDPATNPYSPQQLAQQAAAHNVRWLIVNRHLQLTADPIPNLPDYVDALKPAFTLDHTLNNYDIYRHE